MKTKKTLFLIFLALTAFSVKGQNDTVKIYGVIANTLFYESIELYPDSTFKWTSEYDLSWDEFGAYEFNKNRLVLKYNDSSKVETFLFKEDSIFRLKKSGKKIRRKRDKSIKTKWSWLKLHYHKYKLTQA